MQTSKQQKFSLSYVNRSAPLGFTLIEILVVVTIIGIFATLAVYNLTGYLNFQSQSQAQINQATIADLRTFCMSSSFDTSNTLYGAMVNLLD